MIGALVTAVLVTFASHVDLGFNHGILPNGTACPNVDEPNASCGFSWSVVARHFRYFYPAAVETSELLRKRGGKQRMVYSTQSWLVQLYMDCRRYTEFWPEVRPYCPSREDVERFREAAKRGDISWHAMPFNAQIESGSGTVLEMALNLTRHMEEAEFPGVQPSQVMSQRDVPGFTRAALPILRASGVRLISVGVNQASSPPALPRVFRWVDEESSSDLLATWHPNGYGFMLGSNQQPEDCLVVGTTALCAAFKNDNAGPPNVDEVAQFWSAIQKAFPLAKDNITAVTLNEWVAPIEAVRETLPIVKGEISDTWIYGYGSDPWRVMHFRALVRASELALRQGQDWRSDSWRHFSFYLQKVLEHTSGMDIKRFMHDFNRSWAGPVSSHAVIEASWDEQRFFLDRAISASQALPMLNRLIRDELAALDFCIPALAGMAPVLSGTDLHFGNWSVSLNRDTGSLVSITFPNRVQVSGVFGRVSTTLYSASFLQNKWLDKYLNCAPSVCFWGPLDLGKPGLNDTVTGPQRQVVAKPAGIWRNDTSLVFELDMPFAGRVYSVFDFGDHVSGFRHRVTWINKVPSRLPQSVEITHQVDGTDSALCNMLNRSWIDPCQTIVNGSRSMHAVWGVRNGGLEFKGHDSMLVQLGKNPINDFDNSVPEPRDGFSFVLFDNLYDTNFPVYFPWGHGKGENMTFRFNIEMLDKK